jgi:hypothetical protein
LTFFIEDAINLPTPEEETPVTVEVFLSKTKRTVLLGKISVLIFLTFVYPPSVAYTQHKFFLPLVFKSPYINLTLAWDPNSEPDLAGYKLYIRKSFYKHDKVIDLGLTTRYTVSILMDGTPFFFTITAYNQKGLESGFSNEVQYP